MSWHGVVEWRKVWARAHAWGAGISADRGCSGFPIGAGYGLDLLEVGYRARAEWDRQALELEREEEVIGVG